MVNVSNDQQIKVDHEEVREFNRQMDAIHDEYNDVLADCDATYAEVVAEASKFTENGAPAPIYANTIANTKEALDHFKAQIVKHQENMKKDSESALKYSESAKNQAAESSSQIAGTDTHFTI